MAALKPPPWIQNDYWAPDRETVLNDPSRWGTGPKGEVWDPQIGQVRNPSNPIVTNTAPTTNTRSGQAPAGFVQTKWTDPNWNTTKYTAGGILQGGGTIADVLNNPLFKGWSQEGPDKIKSPTGNIYDLYYDYGGPNQKVQYTQVGFAGSDPRLSDGIKGNYAAAMKQGASQGMTAPGSQGGYGLQKLGSQGFGGNVGQDPLSQYTTGGLLELIMGRGQPKSNLAESLDQALMQRLGGGGEMDARRFESIRAPFDRARRGQLDTLRDQLASRGLMSEPGHLQGPEALGYGRVEENITPQYTQAINDALLNLDQNNLAALNLAGNVTNQRTGNMLEALSGATGRQGMLGQLAIQSLDQNRQWNQFLAQYGLDREKVMWEMQHGDIALLIPLIQAFLQAAGKTTEGYV